ncbi:MAG: efflux RND transporter permease subunit [Planctomycetota bacterium]
MTHDAEGTARQPDTRRSAHVFSWWADHPGVQLVFLIALSTFAAIGIWNPTLITERLWRDASANETRDRSDTPVLDGTGMEFPERPPSNVEPFQVAGGECVLIARVAPADQIGFFCGPRMLAIESVIKRLESMPQIERVLWLDNIPSFNLFGLTGTLLPSPRATSRQFEAARAKTLENPLAVGQLISPDGCTLVIHLTIDWFHVRDDDDVTDRIRRAAEQAADETGADHGIAFLMTGRAPLHLMTVNNHVHDSKKYQLVGYGIMMVSALILFRGLAAVLLVAIAPALGVFWTTGMLRFLDLHDNPFNDIIVPVLISLVGLTDAVHLMVEIRQQRAAGLSPKLAARRGLTRVGLACLLTSVTTAIGFITLTTAHHEVVREFGWCCVVGVAMTFLSVVTVIPLGCRSPLGRRLHVGLGKSLVDQQLQRVGGIVSAVLRNHRWVATLAILSTLVLAIVSLQLKPDEKRFSGLSESGEAARGLRWLDQSLGGLEFGHVTIRWQPENRESEVLTVLQAVEQTLGQESLIGHPLGLQDLLKALPGDGEPAERMSLLDLLPAELKRAFYTPEYRNASVQFRIQDRGIAAYGPTFQRIEAGLQSIQNEHAGFELKLTGDSVWRWKNIYQIVADLATSLGTATIIIWIVLTIVYRSVRIGLISIVPNLFPLAVTAASLVFAGQYLEMVTVCVFTICIGIAVDDTIHFLTRYQEESLAGGTHQDVIRRAFTGVGSALLMTTLVLVAGLASAIAGDSRDARLFGIMGCMTLTAALFADIIFLPALLVRFGKQAQNADPESD